MPAGMFVPVALVCAALILYQYYRVNRLAGGIGWALLVVAIGAFGSGLAESFAWAGLLFSAIGVLGLIVALQEIVYHRHDRKRAPPRQHQDPGNEISD